MAEAGAGRRRRDLAGGIGARGSVNLLRKTWTFLEAAVAKHSLSPIFLPAILPSFRGNGLFENLGLPPGKLEAIIDPFPPSLAQGL